MRITMATFLSLATSLSQGLATLGNVCTAVSRAAEKVEEEWSPRSVDVLVFHSHQTSQIFATIL